jgi:hypothetical protein
MGCSVLRVGGAGCCSMRSVSGEPDAVSFSRLEASARAVRFGPEEALLAVVFAALGFSAGGARGVRGGAGGAGAGEGERIGASSSALSALKMLLSGPRSSGTRAMRSSTLTALAPFISRFRAMRPLPSPGRGNRRRREIWERIRRLSSVRTGFPRRRHSCGWRSRIGSCRVGRGEAGRFPG